MLMYSHFFGVDMSKAEFSVGVHGHKKTQSFCNNKAGIKQFLTVYKKELPTGFVVVEATGGYEKLFLETLSLRTIAIHRADPRKAYHFVKSESVYSKSDPADAIQLALYAAERHAKLPIYIMPEPANEELKCALARRLQLTAFLVAEKNHLQAPDVSSASKKSAKKHIEHIQKLIDDVDERMDKLVSRDEIASIKRDILRSIPGVGDTISTGIIVLLPELGHLNRRQAASLAGVAPHLNESGMHKGYRATKGGRKDVRRFLFLASMSARSSKSGFKTFYEGLIARGKKKMVALVALMRKIILVANALLKRYYKTGEVCLFVK